jgi:hypothetical protein
MSIVFLRSEIPSNLSLLKGSIVIYSFLPYWAIPILISSPPPPSPLPTGRQASREREIDLVYETKKPFLL